MEGERWRGEGERGGGVREREVEGERWRGEGGEVEGEVEGEMWRG